MTRDNTMPEGKWKFDADVTDAFADMLERSIPDYFVMRQAVTSLGRQIIQPHTSIIDLGCARGDALAPFVQEFTEFKNRLVGYDMSEPMLAACRSRFSTWIDAGHCTIECADLREGLPHIALPASLILSVLTLQFIPIEYRQMVLQDCFKVLTSRGALILVEKILGPTFHLNQVFTDIYYELKRENGYTQEAIDRKRLALEGVLVPVTAAWNEDLLRAAGFTQVDCFWRWANFAGWIAVK